jgi:hypothetical protein
MALIEMIEKQADADLVLAAPSPALTLIEPDSAGGPHTIASDGNLVLRSAPRQVQELEGASAALPWSPGRYQTTSGWP